MTVDEAIEALQQMQAEGHGSVTLRVYSELSDETYPTIGFKLRDDESEGALSAGYGTWVEVVDVAPDPTDLLPYKPGAYILHMKDGNTERALIGLMGEKSQLVALVDHKPVRWNEYTELWDRVERAELVSDPATAGAMIQPPDDWFTPAR